MGKPVLTIYIRDKTKQLETFFSQITLREEEVKRQQA